MMSGGPELVVSTTDKRILQLDESVVNQIAAGEVIQRPSSALKELLENAIDAGSKNILVTVKDGGLKLLQITDDGCGIHPDDLPILCHRHTTSKLSKYEDLASIGTLGFRGEALCSVSFVSRLSVTTMQRGSTTHAWKACFRDSEILAPGAQPVAGVPGTAIVVEDLFYNVPNRRRAMGSAADEYARIFDVVAKYAIYCNGVGMSLKRHKEVRADIHTAPTFSRLDCIRAIYGAPLAAALLPICARQAWPDDHLGCPATTPDSVSFSLEGFVLNGDHQLKKNTFILFINGRAVDCPALKRNVEAVYTSLISKSFKVWAFLDVRMPAAHLDVNIHPTKAEVAFLFQGEVVDGVREAVERLLLSKNNTRTFSKAAPAINAPGPAADAAIEREEERTGSTQRAKAGGDHKLIRTDHRSASLKPFLENPTKAPPGATALAGSVRRKGAGLKRRADALGLSDDAAVSAKQPNGASSLIVQQPNPPLVDIPSVESLVSGVERVAHTGLTTLVREYTYVGHVEGSLVLLQHSTKLFLVDIAALSRDLMFQQTLRRFGQVKRIELQPPVSVRDVVLIGLDAKEAAGTWSEGDGPKDTLADMVVELLLMKAELLRECFGVGVDASGCLECLPMLIESYCPDLAGLPHFLLALAADVDWADERECFRTLSEALAEFYSVKPPAALTDTAKGDLSPNNEAVAAVSGSEHSTFEWLVQHVVLPAARHHVRVPRHRATDGSVVQVAALEQLYKVFERC